LTLRFTTAFFGGGKAKFWALLPLFLAVVKLRFTPLKPITLPPQKSGSKVSENYNFTTAKKR
jgi:hypothetical protein